MSALLDPHTDGWLYRLLTDTDDALYIGQTKRHPSERIRQHQKDSLYGRRVQAYAAWWPKVARVEAAEIPLMYLNTLEGELIHAVHPVGNKYCPFPGCGYYASLAGQGGTAAHEAGLERHRRRVIQSGPAW